MANSRTKLGVVLVGVLLLACGEDDPTRPPTVTSLQVVGAATLDGQAGEEVATDPAVRAVDAQGDPVPGVQVTFTVVEGDGFVSPTPVTTDAEGIARTTWLLGPRTGVQRIEAATPGVAPVTITANVAPGPPARIVVSPSTLNFDAMGDSLQASASFTDRFGNPIPSDDVEFAWESLDPDIAIVRSDGWVIALRQGTAQIVARVGDLTGTAAARVMLAYHALDVVQDEVTINALTFTRQLEVEVRDRHGNLIEDPEVTWTSRNEAVVTVGAFGLARAEAVGEAWVVAEGQELVDSVLVRVRQLARDVVVSIAADSLLVGESAAVSVAVVDSAGIPIPDPDLSWEVTPATSAALNGSTLETFGPGVVRLRAQAPGSEGSASVRVLFPAVVRTRISVGGNHALGIGGPERRVYAWGYNGNGQIGDGTTTQRNDIFATDITDAVQVSARSNVSFALLRDGTVLAWGHNATGQLGLGFTESTIRTPQVVPDFHPVWIAAGSDHSLALMGDGTVWATGQNDRGQLGDGTTESRDFWAPVPGLTDVIDVQARNDVSMALKSDGTLWAWGSDSRGKLGIGGTTDVGGEALVPTQVVGLRDVVQFSLGFDHVVALRSDGTVWAWGYDFYDQLGQGPSGGGDSSVPIQVPGLTDIVAIGASDHSNLAIDASGRLWAWGRNNHLQIGDASPLNVNQPTPTVIDVTDVVEVHGAVWTHLVVKRDGTVWGFGRGSFGTIGHGSASPTNVWPPMQTPLPPLN
ncbi:MAG TPA: hypothetical protein VF178_01735 [Gemmatimonadaceae bacterium]